MTKNLQSAGFNSLASGYTGYTLPAYMTSLVQDKNVVALTNGTFPQKDENGIITVAGRPLSGGEKILVEKQMTNGAKIHKVPCDFFNEDDMAVAEVVSDASGKIEELKTVHETLTGSLDAKSHFSVASVSTENAFENNFGYSEATSTAPEAQTLHYDVS